MLKKLNQYLIDPDQYLANSYRLEILRPSFA